MRVSKQASALTVTDASGKVIMHAPVTSGSEHDPLPIGAWTVTAVARNPTFNYNPDLFWDADPAHAKAKLPPGPNGPVGVVWIDINKPHYGIHGTPEPGTVGHTSSHGCVRLTNWDALKLAAMVGQGHQGGVHRMKSARATHASPERKGAHVVARVRRGARLSRRHARDGRRGRDLPIRRRDRRRCAGRSRVR